MRGAKIEFRHLSGGVTAIDLQGSVSKASVPDLNDTIGSLLGEGHNRLILNCRGLRYISSDGIGVLLSYLMRIRGEGGDIKFCSLGEEPKKDIKILGLNNILKIFETEDEAYSDFVKKEDKAKAKEEEHKLAVNLDYQDGDVCVAKLCGFIDRHAIDILDRSLKKALDDNRTKIVVNCAELNYISSSGMGVFIAYALKARNRGGDIRFCNMRDAPRTTITMLGLHNHFQIYESEDQAVESYR
jgi:anti-anti-sigma factor